MRDKNPHRIPLARIVYLDTTSSWEFPLKVVVGNSSELQTTDGRPYVSIAELHTPTKVTYHCHPKNFRPMGDLGKRILLGEVTLDDDR